LSLAEATPEPAADAAGGDMVAAEAVSAGNEAMLADACALTAVLAASEAAPDLA